MAFPLFLLPLFKLTSARWLIDLFPCKNELSSVTGENNTVAFLTFIFPFEGFPLNIPDIVLVDPTSHSNWNNVISGLLKAVQRWKQPSSTLLNLQRLQTPSLRHVWWDIAWDCASQEKVKGTDILLSNIFYDWDKCSIRSKGRRLSKGSACYQFEDTRKTKQFHREKLTHIDKREMVKLLWDTLIKLLHQSGRLPVKWSLLVNLDSFFPSSENISTLNCAICNFQISIFMAFSFGKRSSFWSLSSKQLKLNPCHKTT